MQDNGVVTEVVISFKENTLTLKVKEGLSEIITWKYYKSTEQRF